MKRGSHRVRYLIACAIVLGIAIVFAELVGPRIIEAAYRGESLGILNRALEGRDQHPIERYLALWRQLSRVGLAALCALFALGALWRWKVGAWAGAVLRAEPALSPLQTVALAAWFGAVGGTIEVALPVARHLIGRHPARSFTWEAAWMGPLSAILAFAFVGIVLTGLAWAAGNSGSPKLRVALRPAVFVFAGLAAAGVLSRTELQLADYAVALLGLGVGAGLARVAARDRPRFMRFVRRSAVPAAALLLVSTVLGVATLPDLLERRRLARLGAAGGGPNIILIVLDTLRAASMSLYGYERDTTPNLERFAARGTTFDVAIATAPWTLPSHASMFTGRYPHEMTADIGIPLDDADPTLAAVLTEEGYATAAFVANFSYTTEASGLARGFARYEDYPIHAGRFFGATWLSNLLFARPAGLEDPTAHKSAAVVTDDFLRWLRTRPDRPFFAFLNYIEAHHPYVSPPPFDGRFDVPGQPPVLRLQDKRENITFAEMEGTRSAYDNAIAYADDQLGRLFGELDRNGLLDNTIVVITSDHGEHLGEHGLQLHTNSLYMPLLHVPLLVRFPRAVPEGLRVASPATIRDIPRTVLELAGLGRETGLGGASLSRHWKTPGDGERAAEPLLSELNYWGVEQDLIRPWDPVYLGNMKSIVLGDLHFIRDGRQTEQIFDLSTDPAESNDLRATIDPERLQTLLASLDSLLGMH